jgi:hypothetical protein
LNSDDDASSKHWNKNEEADAYADNADFSFFCGHGGPDGIAFGTQNSALDLIREDMCFGGGRAKWVTLDACSVLNDQTQKDLESIFNGVHIVNGFDTIGELRSGVGATYATKLRGIGKESRQSIRDAWKYTLKERLNMRTRAGAYM